MDGIVTNIKYLLEEISDWELLKIKKVQNEVKQELTSTSTVARALTSRRTDVNLIGTVKPSNFYEGT